MGKKSGLSYMIFFMAVCGFVPGVFAQDITDKPFPPDIHVSGVIYDGKEPVAVVNGEIVREGSLIGDVRVVRVTEAEVEFQYQGKVFVRKIGALPSNQPVVVREIKKTAGFSLEKLLGRQTFSRIKSQREFKKLKVTLQQQLFKIIGGVIIFFVAAYIYTAVTLQKIADKTGTENSWLAWIPLANLYLQCEVADKPAWWLPLLLLPYINVVIIVIIWINIAKARGKPGWLGMLIVLPLLNFVVMGYLAFSGSVDKSIEKQESEKRPVIDIIGGPIK